MADAFADHRKSVLSDAVLISAAQGATYVIDVPVNSPDQRCQTRSSFLTPLFFIRNVGHHFLDRPEFSNISSAAGFDLTQLNQPVQKSRGSLRLAYSPPSRSALIISWVVAPLVRLL